MVKLNKIFTKQGDKGMTSLVGGTKVSKCDLRLESYGTIDELNSCLGIIIAHCDALPKSDHVITTETDKVFHKISNTLFDIGSLLATENDVTYPGMKEIKENDITYLEERITFYQTNLENPKSFVLPGSGIISSHAHMARCVCRRAERIMVNLHETDPIKENLLIYINRLSDYLFVYSRWVTKLLKETEQYWD